MTRSGIPTIRLQPYVLIILCAASVALCASCRCAPDDVPLSTEQGVTPTAVVSTSSACEGWPATVALEPQRLLPFNSPAWHALRQGRPIRAFHLFSTEKDDSPVGRIGAMRARVALARALFFARNSAFLAQRTYLDARLKKVPDQPGAAVFPLLRASVALQTAEPVDVGPWLQQIPDSSPLSKARDVLREVAREPLAADASPIAEATWRWLAHFPKYAKALPEIDCPLSGAATERARILALWLEAGLLPAPARWSTLQLGEPDFDFGGCDAQSAYKIDLYDPSLYTLMGALAIQEPTGEAASSPLQRFLWLRVLELSDPESARREACSLQTQWQTPDPDEALSYLVFGEYLSIEDVKTEVARLCSMPAEDAQCPADADQLRSLLESQQDWADGCYRTLSEESSKAGEFARRLQLYSPVARDQYLGPLLTMRCSPGLTDTALRHWRGAMLEGTGWASLEATLAWVWIDVGMNRYEEGPREAFMLSETTPLFRPLFETIRRAGSSISHVPGSGGG